MAADYRTVLDIRRSLTGFCLMFTLFSGAGGAPGLDPTFGNQGVVTTSLPGQPDATAMGVLLGKRIVVAGVVTSPTGDSDFALAGYKLNGKLDAFGGGGTVITAIGSFSDDVPWAIAVQPDGKIIVAGHSQPLPGDSAFCAVRYTTNGALDTTFGTGGKALVKVGKSNSGASAVAIQPNGKIVMAGAAENVGPNTSDFAVVRLTAFGKPDPTFGYQGRMMTDIGKYEDVAGAVTIQPDQKIVVAGASSDITSSKSAFSLVRLTPNGALDKTFGAGGKVLTALNDNQTRARSVGLQKSGRIVVGGLGQLVSPTTTYTMMGFDSDGKLDPSFGVKGVVNTIMVNNSVGPRPPMLIRPDDKIVAAGFPTVWLSGFGITGYDKNGAVLGFYATNGPISTAGSDLATGIALQPDGKILVSGTVKTATGSRFAVVRYIVNW